jgi:D-glycerate 3-kinase
VLKGLLDSEGLPTAVLSIDDLYLTHAQRLHLGERVHPLLRTRGVPGTHDVPLGLATLERLRCAGPVALPRFDKQHDDRLPRAQWPMFDAPASVVILEGWCVGALPQTDAELSAPVNTLERNEDPQGTWRGYANDALRGAYRELFGHLDMLLLLAAPSFDVVHGWRLEQEHKLRDTVTAAGGDVSRLMDDAGIARFVSHYERITRHILREMPGRADVVLELDAHRAPLRLRGA